jgi:hypothetical protein
VARAVRYYFWGILAFILRDEVKQVFAWLEHHFFTVFGAVIVGVLLAFALHRLYQAIRNRSLRSRAQASYSD